MQRGNLFAIMRECETSPPSPARGLVPEPDRHNQSGEPVLVLQPAAPAGLAALRELAPVVVDVLRDLAADYERDRLVELELRPAFERDERLAVKLEGHRHHTTPFVRRGVVSRQGARGTGV